MLYTCDEMFSQHYVFSISFLNVYSSARVGVAVVLNSECSLVSCDAVLHLLCFPAVVPPFKLDFLSCRPTVSAKS